MKDEYISVAEFAKMAGVSVQAIYKRLDKDFKPWLKVEDGKKVINIKALEVFKCAKSSTEVEITEALLRMVSMLEKELEIKNEQIREQNRQISDLHDRLKESYVLIDQQQHLHVANLLEEKILADAGSSTVTVIDPEGQKSTGKKKKLWQFWK